MPTVKSGQLIVAAILAIFVYGVIAFMLGTVMPKFDLNDAQLGTIATFQAIGLVIASISVGPLIDAKGKKTALILALVLIAASLFALANVTPNAESKTLIGVLFFILGVGGGILVTASNALASDIGENRRASVLNFLNLFFGLGGLATPFLAVNVLGNDRVRILYCAAILATITLVFQIVTRMPGPSGDSGFKASEMRLVLNRPALYLLSVFLFLYVACEVGLTNWLMKYLISQNIDAKTAGNILSLGFALGLLVGRVVVSRVLIRISAVTVTLAASVLMAITTYLVLETSSATMAWVAVFCAGLAMAPMFPTTLAMVGDAFPRMTATAMGIVITCGWIGLAVTSRIIGSVANSSGLRNGLLLIPAFSVIMVFVNLLLRPALKRA